MIRLTRLLYNLNVGQITRYDYACNYNVVSKSDPNWHIINLPTIYTVSGGMPILSEAPYVLYSGLREFDVPIFKGEPDKFIH